MEWEYERITGGKPHPIVECVFKNPHEPRRYSTGPRKCIVDTGSFACALHKKDIQSLRLTFRRKFRVADLDGKVTDRFGWPVLVDLFDPKTGMTIGCDPVHVLEIGKRGHPIVGRDVLNQFSVTLDGPNRTCRIE